MALTFVVTPPRRRQGPSANISPNMSCYTWDEFGVCWDPEGCEKAHDDQGERSTEEEALGYLNVLVIVVARMLLELGKLIVKKIDTLDQHSSNRDDVPVKLLTSLVDVANKMDKRIATMEERVCLMERHLDDLLDKLVTLGTNPTLGEFT